MDIDPPGCVPNEGTHTIHVTHAGQPRFTAPTAGRPRWCDQYGRPDRYDARADAGTDPPGWESSRVQIRPVAPIIVFVVLLTSGLLGRHYVRDIVAALGTALAHDELSLRALGWCWIGVPLL